MKQMKQAAKKIGILAIWIALWQIAYLLVGQELIMPSPLSVAKRIYFLSGETNYWYSIAASMARITAGYLAGLAAGMPVCCNHYHFLLSSGVFYSLCFP